jgi:hypothetical protein
MPQTEIFLQLKDGFFDQDGAVGAGSKAFIRSWLEKLVDGLN